jgi:hypothetical protein
MSFIGSWLSISVRRRPVAAAAVYVLTHTPQWNPFVSLASPAPHPMGDERKSTRIVVHFQGAEPGARRGPRRAGAWSPQRVDVTITVRKGLATVLLNEKARRSFRKQLRRADAGGDEMLPSRDHWNEALEAFGEGRYMEAHDVFESLWRRAEGQNREFFQGRVLLAAALFHRDRGSNSGAQRCFERAAEHWQGLPWRFRGLKISDALGAVEEVLGREWATPELPTSSPERSAAPRPQGGDRS